MRYSPKTDSKFAYKVEIIAELPGRVDTSTGTISYEVKSSGEIVKLDYTGGLTTKSKYNDSDDSRFGPPGFRRRFGMAMPIGGFFDAKNLVSLTPQGKLQALDGSSQLPYLLGNLSILAFEPLSPNDDKTWTSKNDVSIYESSSSGWHRRPFGWPGSGPEKITAGSESTTFTYKSEKGDIVTFAKTYRLHSEKDKESVTITGNGIWAFNRRLNIPESLDCKYDMNFKKDNVSVTLPVTVKYNRLSDEEFAKYEQEKKEKREKIKAEHEKRLAKQKAPITGEERTRILKELKSNDQHKLFALLVELKQMEPRDDKDIAKAIKPLLKHSSDMVRDQAADALVKFAPDLGQKIKINKEYSSIHNVNTTGAPVTARMSLPAGLIVAVNDIGPWYKAAKVVRKHKDGQVEVEFVGFNRVKTVHYSKIRLAPPEVDQPFVSKRILAKLGLNSDDDDAVDDDSADEDEDEADSEPVAKSDRGYRTWTDNTGTFAIVAKYVDIDGKNIKLLRKKDGKEIQVPLSRLSEDDRKMAERLQAAPKPGNPFE